MAGRAAGGAEELPIGAGHTVGGYRLLNSLGAGGMGQVFVARSGLGRTVAVKVVKPELAAEREFRERFRKEVEAARLVGGEWTAPVLDADTEAAAPWVATGYIPGPSLQHVVSSSGHGPMPPESLRVLAYGLSSALLDIHRAGLVHRDLKPSNVLVTIEGPRVIDFGISRALDAVSESTLTRTGAVVGSPAYMSPEQIRGEHITQASDVFSMGAVLAYAATGRPPFSGEAGGLHSMMYRIAVEEPDLDGLQEPLRELVAECLAKEPAMRPSAEKLVSRLRPPQDGTATPPWLPAELIAELGQQAAKLLDAGGPEESDAHGTPPDAPSQSGAEAPAAEPSPERDPATPPEGNPPTTAQPANEAGAGYAGTPGPPGGSTGSGGSRTRGGWRRTAVGLVACLVVLGTGYTAMEAETNGSEGSDGGAASDVPESYLGTWTGAVERDGQPTGEHRRFVISNGQQGDTVASGASIGGDYACNSDGKLVKAGSQKQLRLNTRTVKSVPEGECSAAGQHRLRPGPDGSTLVWSADDDRTATLRKVQRPEKLSADLLGTWQRPLPNGGTQKMTVRQRPPGKGGITLVSEGAQHCEANMALFSTGGANSPVRVAPPDINRDSSDDTCVAGSSSLLRAENGQLIREFPDGSSRIYTPVPGGQ